MNHHSITIISPLNHHVYWWLSHGLHLINPQSQCFGKVLKPLLSARTEVPGDGSPGMNQNYRNYRNY